MTNSGYLDSPFAHSKVNQSRSTTASNRNKVGLNAAGYSASANTPSFTTSASRLFAAQPASSSSTLPLTAPKTGSILVHHDHLTSTKPTGNSYTSMTAAAATSTATAVMNGQFTASSQQYQPQSYKQSNYTSSLKDNNNSNSSTSKLSHAVS